MPPDRPAQPQGHSLQGKVPPRAQGTALSQLSCLTPHSQTVPKTPAALRGKGGEMAAGKKKGRKGKGGRERESGKGRKGKGEGERENGKGRMGKGGRDILPPCTGRLREVPMPGRQSCQQQHGSNHGLQPAFPKAQPGTAGKAQGAHSPKPEHFAAKRGRWEPGLPAGDLENRKTNSMCTEWTELGVRGRLW